MGAEPQTLRAAWGGWMSEPHARPPFDWSDPLDLDGALTEEERLVRDAVRDFADGALMPRIRDAYRHETFDRAVMTEMGRADRALRGVLRPDSQGRLGGPSLVVPLPFTAR